MALIYPTGLAATDFSDGSTGPGWSPQSFIYGGHFVLTSAGDITQLGVKCADSGVAIAGKIGLYNSSGTLLAQSTFTSPASGTLTWRDSGAISQSVAAGTYYVLCSGATDQMVYGYDTSGAGSYATENYATAMASSETITDQGDANTLYGVRMDFTATAGVPRQMMHHIQMMRG